MRVTVKAPDPASTRVSCLFREGRHRTEKPIVLSPLLLALARLLRSNHAYN